MGIWASYGALAVFGAVLADAARTDLARYTIEDRTSLILLAAFPLAALAFGLGWGDVLAHVGAGALALVVAFVLFALGAWGGGDAKLVPAVLLWVGFAGMGRFLAVMTLVGGVVALTLVVAKRLPEANGPGLRLWLGRMAESGHVPYGVAIAAAGFDWLVLRLFSLSQG
jgi:prepilin peptidase CpaA